MARAVSIWAIARVLLLAWLVVLVASVPDATATFPGPNGKIAFHSNRSGNYDIWTVAPDGSDLQNLTVSSEDDFFPAWSPDGWDIAFSQNNNLAVTDADRFGALRLGPTLTTYHAWSPDKQKLAYVYFGEIYTKGAEASSPGVRLLQPDGATESGPDWSPDGSLIAYAQQVYDVQSGEPQYVQLKVIHPDGTGGTALTGSEHRDLNPSISPDGESVVFSRAPSPAVAPGGVPDLYTIPIDGGTPTRLTDTPSTAEEDPAWSPDGTKIAFSAGPRPSGGTFNGAIYVMNANGTGLQQITSATSRVGGVSWRGAVQPAKGFPRPKSALLVEVPLVPGYKQCTSPNRTHGPPMAFESCSPPAAASGTVTFGTADANGLPTRSEGSLRVKALAGDPSTTPDEADVRIELSLTDVRRADNPAADYSGLARLLLPLRITDKDSGCCRRPGTVPDLDLFYDIGCAATADPSWGGTCALTTSAEAFTPWIREGTRTVWELVGSVGVYDEDGGVIATQGVFVP